MDRIHTKIIFLLSIFILVFLFLTSNIFAADTTKVDFSYYQEMLKNEKRPYLLFRDAGKQYFSLFILPCNNHYQNWDYEHDDIFLYKSGDDVVARNATKNEETRHFADYATNNGKDVIRVHSCWGGTINWLTDVYLEASEAYSSVPVYSDINKTKIFFFKVPLLQSIQINQIPVLIQKILIILIPVGLIIFSSFLVVYLLKSKKWLLR